MNDNVLVQIQKYIENNAIEDALNLILSKEKDYEHNADFWNLKGVLCYKAAEVAVAVSCFARAVELDPNHEEAQENLTYSRALLSDGADKDSYALNDEEFVITKVDILDNVIIEVETFIKGINTDNSNTDMTILKNVQDVMKAYGQEMTRLKAVVPSRFMPNVFENVLLCLEDCLGDFSPPNDGRKLSILVEFTLYSLLKELREEIYFFGSIFPDTGKMDSYYKKAFAKANANQYAQQSLQTGKFKYPVSILVPAYNKLEFSKQCIESILRYTKDVEFELILVNDGSSDGTKDYFNSVPHDNKKVINLYKNTGPTLAYLIGMRAAEGRVLATVSNDVIVTESWLENLLTCLDSDSNIGIVVPATGNISNGQDISVSYQTIEEMQRFSRNYNVSDRSKWFERERLCPFLNVIPMEVFGKGLCPDRLYQYAEFSDDDFSLQLRLQGYKLILAKDTFCHHFGSISLGEAQRENDSLQISRALFKQKNKVDAWHDSQDFGADLLKNLDMKESESINVLCIDPGFGMIPYQITNQYKQNRGTHVRVHNFSTLTEFLDISSKILDNYTSADTTADLISVYEGMTFDYILLCRPLDEYEDSDLLLRIKKLLSNEGEIRFLINNPCSGQMIIDLLSLNTQSFKKILSSHAVTNLLIAAGFTDVRKVGIAADSLKLVQTIKKLAASLDIQLDHNHEVLYGSDALLFIAKG
ncbi:glycosyltransferase [Paenibacillus sp. FJAT-26967]|uniref:glycosyltransferase n=1 Tax=Paenibacillus sp. FJAT-26967 TaxID=1729690 RepID=UPI0008389E4B|nr:glycosyltransferase [Paenibacillus sp. FJAT-26967]